jgi:hypothetical protein
MPVTICLTVDANGTDVHVIDRQINQDVWKTKFDTIDRPSKAITSSPHLGTQFGTVAILGPDGHRIDGGIDKTVAEGDLIQITKSGTMAAIVVGGCRPTKAAKPPKASKATGKPSAAKA